MNCNDILRARTSTVFCAPIVRTQGKESREGENTHQRSVDLSGSVQGEVLQGLRPHVHPVFAGVEGGTKLEYVGS